MKKVKKVLVTYSERLEMPFKEIGSDNMKIKVVDLDKVGAEIRKYRTENNMSPFIEFRATKYDKRKGFNFTHTFEKDPSTGIYYGIVIGIHSDGNPKWLKIPMTEFERLDLNKDIDMKKWIVLRMCSHISGSPFAISNENGEYDDAKYVIYDSEEEAREKIDKAKNIGSAIERINKLRDKKLFDFARFLGIDVMNGMNDTVLRGLIIDYALKDSSDFNFKWNHVDRGVCETFYNAYKSGVIKHEYAKGYMYKDITLGMGESESIEYLKTDVRILTAMQMDVDKNDTVRNSYMELIDKISNKISKEDTSEEEQEEIEDENIKSNVKPKGRK